MGNSVSAEAPWRGQRSTQKTTQKLSKPKTGNPTAAGLLNSSGLLNPSRPSPVARRLSLPDPPSPVTSPILPETIPAVPASVPSEKKGLDIGHRLLRRLSRSSTPKESPAHRQRSTSIDVAGAQQERWSSRTSSLRNGPEEGYNYGQPPIQGSSSMNGSRTSFNYDFRSYEANRLLNLVEVPSNEDTSATSGNVHTPEAVRSDSRNRRPSIPETTPIMTRAGSEVSLYTPMRRRSLMTTPGIATREPTPNPEPPLPKTRYSLPSTPAHRESRESMAIGALSIPPLPIDPIPRALTPVEAEYKQTGAFKLGTLRITNGSPERSPARDNTGTKSTTNKQPDDYFRPVEWIADGGVKTETSNIIEITEIQNGELLAQPLPELHIIPPLAENEKGTVPSMQVTSKHSAAEDNLFEDETNEYSSAEVLDVRVDANAKSAPPRPKSTSERKNSKEISRSDSGIASPASEYSQAALSKADSGYSSSVSLRSFSSRPPVAEKDRSSDIEVEVPGSPKPKEGGLAGELEAISPTASIVRPQPFNDLSPPPVPMKDRHLMASSPRGVGESFHYTKPKDTLKGNQVPERMLSLRNARSQANRMAEARQAALRNPPISNSTLSISTGFRKPGKLQRLLSGGRAPLTTHTTHPNEYSRVPTISRDMQAKLQVHAGMKPISFRRLALRSAASKETLGTILSVGSAELLQDDEMSPKGSSGHLKSPDRTISSKKPIPRKPVPFRSRALSMLGEPTNPSKIDKGPQGNESILNSAPRNTAEGTFVSTHSVATSNRARYSLPAPPRLTRSNTMTGQRERDLGMTQARMRRSSEFAPGKPRSSATLELPPPVPNMKLSKSPPPVSMRTRNMGSLRVPPPPRSQSTPPESMMRSSRLHYSRRGSRGASPRIPEVINPPLPNHNSMSRQSSRESFQGYPTQTYHGGKAVTLTVNNQPGSLQAGVAGPRASESNSQADHGQLSRRSSSDYSRRSSVGSQSSKLSSATTGPILRHQYHSNPSLPSLHRRSSYDDYNLVPQDSSIRDNGPYPSISRNGQTVVSDPWSGRSMSMPHQELDQPIQRPPHNPRQHHRHRSMDQYGNPTPYRVLHSYNSPAYRHVPIWR
ncbi:hypothetical protein M426DRAFT_190346 [Hypoxylon sp. CI-4A]|nr:hypothetical protein M426DRAFT_190346 [Hypoxylon sp. CI-4A]